MILYEGPSLLDGTPIVVLATGFKSPSSNRKTGPMIQTYILAQGTHPKEAIQDGTDAAVCGTCPARGTWCYASIGAAGMGLGAVWKAYKAGNQPPVAWEQFRNRAVRFGAYGDPCAAPTWIWDRLARTAAVYTGYTHQWRTCDPEMKKFCMASVDSLEEQRIASAAGWRCFRVVQDVAEKVKGEVICPHYTTGIQCINCGACDGGSRDLLGHIVTASHGSQATQFRRYQENLREPLRETMG